VTAFLDSLPLRNKALLLLAASWWSATGITANVKPNAFSVNEKKN